jgi:predicted nucleic acid-binding protein
VIVDTNALSAFAGGSKSVREALAAASGPHLPVIVLGEYRFGLLSSHDRKARLEWLEKLAAYWTVLDVTEATACHYAAIRQELRKNATPIPSNDAWIAALALQQNLPILSNDSHFDLVPGIRRVGFSF